MKVIIEIVIGTSNHITQVRGTGANRSRCSAPQLACPATGHAPAWPPTPTFD